MGYEIKTEAPTVTAERAIGGGFVAWTVSEHRAILADCPLLASYAAIRNLREARENRPLRKQAEREFRRRFGPA